MIDDGETRCGTETHSGSHANSQSAFWASIVSRVALKIIIIGKNESFILSREKKDFFRIETAQNSNIYIKLLWFEYVFMFPFYGCLVERVKFHLVKFHLVKYVLITCTRKNQHSCGTKSICRFVSLALNAFSRSFKSRNWFHDSLKLDLVETSLRFHIHSFRQFFILIWFLLNSRRRFLFKKKVVPASSSREATGVFTFYLASRDSPVKGDSTRKNRLIRWCVAGLLSWTHISDSSRDFRFDYRLEYYLFSLHVE